MIVDNHMRGVQHLLLIINARVVAQISYGARVSASAYRHSVGLRIGIVPHHHALLRAAHHAHRAKRGGKTAMARHQHARTPRQTTRVLDIAPAHAHTLRIAHRAGRRKLFINGIAVT